MAEWQLRGKASDYLDPRPIVCDLCGKSIPRRAWVSVHDGLELIFCDPDCERLYHEYWLPRYARGKL
jgi:ribosomal protein L24E